MDGSAGRRAVAWMHCLPETFLSRRTPHWHGAVCVCHGRKKIFWFVVYCSLLLGLSAVSCFATWSGVARCASRFSVRRLPQRTSVASYALLHAYAPELITQLTE